MGILILALLALVSACGGAEAGEDRSGTGGMAGAGGSGGTTTIPADLDQLCRDFCANEAEGEDCGVENCSRFIDYCTTGSGQPPQQCYEGCLMEYSERVAGSGGPFRGAGYTSYPRPNCPEEWVTWMECVVNQYECNDLFGDCDNLEPQGPCPYSTAEMEQWCANNCDHAYDECVGAEGVCPPAGEPGSLTCETLENPPPGCDAPCPSGSDSECELGTFCLNNVCSAHCTASQACAQGFSCSSRGRCVPNMGTGGTGGTGGNGCQSVQVTPIISGSISCEVQIDKPFDDREKACNEGDVRLNGTPLSCPTDWQVKDEPPYDVIELVGSACETFKSGESTLTAEFPCGAIVIE